MVCVVMLLVVVMTLAFSGFAFLLKRVIRRKVGDEMSPTGLCRPKCGAQMDGKPI